MRRAAPMCVLLLFLLPLVFGVTNVSVATDWRVAYLLGYYSRLAGDGFLAADSPATAREVLPYLLPKNDIIVVYEDTKPFVKNYENVLRGMGFTNVRTVKVDNPYALNFDLVRTHGPFDCYVLVQDTSGEWVYAAGAYAFANRCAIVLLNNASLDRIIASVPKDAKVTVVGYQGKRLREAFPNATFIATGNKAKDAAELARNFPRPFDQVLFVSGMYLYLPVKYTDPPFWTGVGGRYPVLIAYPDGIPEATEEFIEERLGRLAAVLFIGPELDTVFGVFREKYLGKIGKIVELVNIGFQGVPTRASGVPYPLPVLLLPSGNVKIDLENVSALPDGKVFLTFRNLGDAAGYVAITYISIKCGGLAIEPEPPAGAILVPGRDSTIVEINAGEALPTSGCKLYVEARYGPDADRLMFDFNKEIGFIPASIDDPSSLSIERVLYSPRLEAFVIYVKNESPVRVYATPYLLKVYVDGVPTDFKGRTAVLQPGEKGKLYVKAYLTDADLIDNPEVNVLIRYGKYRNLPVKVLEGTYPLEKETLTDIVLEFLEENWVVVAVGLALLIVLVLILRRR